MSDILASAISAELPFLRQQAEFRMQSRVAVRRRTGDVTVVDGLEFPEWEDVYTDLPFRLDGGSTGDGGSTTVTIGGVQFEQATAVGHMPTSTDDLADNDLIDVISGEWAGSVYKIVKAIKKDQATARRVPVVDVDRPEEWS